jgi:hypothetical protein
MSRAFSPPKPNRRNGMTIHHKPHRGDIKSDVLDALDHQKAKPKRTNAELLSWKLVTAVGVAEAHRLIDEVEPKQPSGVATSWLDRLPNAFDGGP